MTLIASGRCADGIVLCADSQETAGDYRLAVLKLEPISMGKFSVVISGSGLAELIEGFVARLTDRMKGEDTANLQAFKAIVEDEYRSYRRDEIPLHPSPKRSKNMILMIGAVSIEGFEVWKTFNGRLKPLGDYDLIGTDYELYKTILARFWKAPLHVGQGILAGIHLLALAEKTSNYVMGPFSVCVVTRGGIVVEDAKYLKCLEEALGMYEEYVNEMFLAGADAGILPSQFQDILIKFCARSTHLHKLQVTRVFDALQDSTGPLLANYPYKRLMHGFTGALGAGEFDDYYTDEEKRELIEKVKAEAMILIPRIINESGAFKKSGK